jgi:hypothetical protein
MDKSDVIVDIVVNGKPVKKHSHDDKTFIEARSGTEYSVKISNNYWARQLAVITVDGVNVISGEPAGSGVGQGYIVSGYGTIDIKGFRKDTNSVGAFKFTKKGNSYCNEKGLGGNNGVIGVRIYAEKQKPILVAYRAEVPRGSYYKGTVDCISQKSFGDVSGTFADTSNTYTDNNVLLSYTTSVNQTSPDFDLGTTWGKQINDSVTYVTFDTDENSYNDYIIFYDTKQNLQKIGIQFNQEKQVFYPTAFGAFAKPPKGWRG